MLMKANRVVPSSSESVMMIMWFDRKVFQLVWSIMPSSIVVFSFTDVDPMLRIWDIPIST